MANDDQISLFDFADTEAIAAPASAHATDPLVPSPTAGDAKLIPTSAKIPIPAGTYDSMESMRSDCAQCQRCGLGATRTHPVVSRGNPQALIMIIGEGPGENEDLTGKPFVGKAGQLLDKILESVSLTEDDVFICNIVKCRPPGNRKPTAKEMEACRPYLLEQIRLVNPQMILLTGGSAVEGLFAEKGVKITQIRGQWREWEGRQCLPMFHPSYLLRNPSKAQGSPKWLMWQDIRDVRSRWDELRANAN
jgi:uracil-DNA glycosylase